MTLAKFHTAIQRAFGWQDYHLHEFRIGGESFGTPNPDADPGLINEVKIHFAGVLGQVRAKARYTYDFGDDWEHDIVVEKVLVPEPGVVYPVCSAGKRSGPPEDCGGPFGYMNLVKTLQDPNSEEHDGMLEWVGGGFDPEAFSVDDVNRSLKPLQRRRPNG
jgi:hypothetical protein